MSPRQQQLAEQARRALEQGQHAYALEATAEILRAAPGCLAVRRLQRRAQLDEFRAQRRWVRRLRSRVGLAPVLLARSRPPALRLAAAERLLALDPTNWHALGLLAEAALALKWPETAAFAREAMLELRPGDRANRVALGEAWLGAGRPEPALRVAREVLQRHPSDARALELLRHASIAQTMAKGNWESPGTFREKLRA